MIEKLKESGITPARAKGVLKLPLYDRASAEKELPELSEHRGGFKITYFDLAGTPIALYRFRYLQDGGFEELTGKPKRYHQSKPGIYIYWSPEVDWLKVAKSDEPIYITEGELKAMCACYLGLPTAGLGGVNMFIKGKGERELHPDLKKVLTKKGRKVYIVYDSDAAANPNVRLAENRLADELTSIGALPSIVRLPSISSNAGKTKKTGFDDYLVRRGKEAFLALVAEAEPYDKARELNRLAAEVVYITGPDIVYCPATDQRMKTEKFVTSHYADWHYTTKINEGTKAEKVVEKDTAKEFLRWPARPKLQEFTFAPGQERIVENKYNLCPGWIFVPKKGDVRLWRKLLDHIFARKPQAERKWFEQWVAYPMQHPGAKLMTAVMFIGGQGTGKTFVGETIMRIYGWRGVGERPMDKSTAAVFDNADLNSTFTDWMESKQFLLGEEIGVDISDRGAASDRLKQLITGLTVKIHHKFLKPYHLPNCGNIMLTSNRPNAIKVAPDDRRYFIERVQEVLPVELHKLLHEWVRTEEAMQALFHYFLYEVDTTGFEPNEPALKTADRSDMVTATANAHELWVKEAKQDPDQYLKAPYEYWTADELLGIYKLTSGGLNSSATASTMGNALFALGFSKAYDGPVRTNAGQKNLWFWPRWPNKSDSQERHKLIAKNPAKVGRAYDKEREFKAGKAGTQPEKEKEDAHN